MKFYDWLPENVILGSGNEDHEFEHPHFDTFADMIEYNRSLGATHITMSNYHSGAFWLADHATVDGDGKTRVAMNHFHSGDASGPSGRNQGWTCGNIFTLSWDRHDVSPRNKNDYHYGLTGLRFVPLDEVLEQDYVKNAVVCNDMGLEFNDDELIKLNK